MDEETLTELQFSTNMMGSITSLYRKTRMKANQNISPSTAINSRTNMRQGFKMKEYSS